MGNENNMVQGLADTLYDVCAMLEAELKERRQAIITRNFQGDESAYTAWVTRTFTSSGSNMTRAEIQWLRAHTTPENPSVPSVYPG